MEDSENYVEKSNETMSGLSSTDSEYDSMIAGESVREMWLNLAQQIAACIHDTIIGGDDPQKAIKRATCAEACYWKATGDADVHDVKDVLKS
ncbi:hypothetical protein BN961_02150 [Afipia felis]|uniref:Uncharacterized protein n=1 Tax=Afipia felis TaxID=1035 RepID=A0A090MR63_AFIFE|nr:hypothetical protein [Afipia felis]CEG08732.1 hypothetical protein BN961_02150 [Afipia felis]